MSSDAEWAWRQLRVFVLRRLAPVLAPIWRFVAPFVPYVAFLLTVVTVLGAGVPQVVPGDDPPLSSYWRGWTFAVPLLSILLAHEFGHYFAARFHGVPASLPVFLPMPWSPFGTFGAVIGMPDRIASRRALLDIGAAGPLAGMVLAIPILAYGLTLSDVRPLDPHGLMEGQSLLYLLMKRVFVGVIQPGHDVFLHPVAFAGWTGLFITMINLLPVGQLDGGHVAYALFGEKQDRYGARIRTALLPLCGINLVRNLWPVYRAGWEAEAAKLAITNSLFWLFWFVLLGGILWLSGGKHPPVDDGEKLGPVRRVIAVGSLVLFVLLFMPAPLTVQ